MGARSVAFPDPRRKCTGFLVEKSRDRLCRLDCARTQANKDNAADLKIGFALDTSNVLIAQ
jgi:hypothetical protein